MNIKKEIMALLRTINVWLRMGVFLIRFRHFGIHYHFTYYRSLEDSWIIWKALHKAHIKYADKLNKKYGAKIYDSGHSSNCVCLKTYKQWLKNVNN